jgi:DNA helicase HerA-like ATPase
MTARHPIPDAALEHHVAVLGKTGSGKSYAAQGIVERLIKKRARVCLIDPTDRYWGLRLDADGKKPSGHEVVIFGGQRADLPLAETHGATLAEIVGTTATPVIISTRLMTVGQRTRFFTTFAETLLAKNEGPLHLVIDEAHLFAPQTKVASVESGQLLHATNNLVSLGRGIGLRIMLLSQRPAKLHKDS